MYFRKPSVCQDVVSASQLNIHPSIRPTELVAQEPPSLRRGPEARVTDGVARRRHANLPVRVSVEVHYHLGVTHDVLLGVRGACLERGVARLRLVAHLIDFLAHLVELGREPLLTAHQVVRQTVHVVLEAHVILLHGRDDHVHIL